MQIGDFLTFQQRADIIMDTIDKISNINSDYAPDNSVLSFKTTGYISSNCYGRTYPDFNFEDGDVKCTITIELAEPLYRHGLEDLLINTIAHEYCHYLQLFEMYNVVKFRADQNGEPKVEWQDPAQELYYFGEDHAGHSESWYKFVNVINNKLGLKFPITPKGDELEHNLYHGINKDLTKFVIHCPNNDIPAEYFFESSFKDLLITGDYKLAEAVAAVCLNKARCAKCESLLKIEFTDQAIEREFRSKVNEFIAFIALRNFLGGGI